MDVEGDVDAGGAAGAEGVTVAVFESERKLHAPIAAEQLKRSAANDVRLLSVRIRSAIGISGKKIRAYLRVSSKTSDCYVSPLTVFGRFAGVNDGGADADRTRDPQLAKLVLYQLSYGPTLRV